MNETFERGFLSELKVCLAKVAAADSSGGAAAMPEARSPGDLAEAMGDVEALEHRIRHMAPARERRDIHARGQAIARERTRGLHEKTASPFAEALQALAGRLLADG